MPSQETKDISIRQSEFFRRLAQRLSQTTDEFIPMPVKSDSTGDGQTETSQEDADE